MPKRSRGAAPAVQADELGALDGLADTIEDNVRDERLLARRVRQLRAARATGRPWRDLLASKPGSGVLELSSQVLGRATAISASLRRRLARGLRSEGETIPAIGQTFGVSHQRASALLRDATARPAPVIRAGFHTPAKS